MTKIRVSKEGAATVIDSEDPMNEDAHFSTSSDSCMMRILPRWLCYAAESGEREAIANVAGLCADLMERIDSREPLKIQERYLLDWLRRKMAKIAAGEQPDVALDWTRPGRSGKKPTLYRDMQRGTMYMMVVNEKEANPELPLEEIFELVAAEKNVSAATVKKAYQDWKKAKEEYRKHLDKE